MKKRLLICQIILIVSFVLFAAATTAYTLLDAFVLDREVFDPEDSIAKDPTFTLIPPKQDTPETTKNSIPESTAAPSAGTSPLTTTETPISTEAPIEYPIIEDLYYKDENIEIDIEEKYFYRDYRGDVIETRYFVIDLQLSDIEYLRTYFREENGKVEKATTSELAEDVGAIFAINGDYFSFRKSGFVVRNYVTYRDTRRKLSDPVLNGDDTLFILPNGSFMMFDENDPIFDHGLPSDIFHAFSFGPRLIENNTIKVNKHSEAGQSAESNPRTAIGMIEPGHYIILVSEGRLYDHDGMTLLEIAQILDGLGCRDAYNLDGGSSTTLYFNGKVINTPGRSDGSEREISDIIYINGLTYSED